MNSIQASKSNLQSPPPVSPARPPFRIKISVFILLISLAILGAFMLIGREVTNSMNFVVQVARDVRDEKLPLLAEDQRTFVNIESLRRIAEVTYVSMDPQKRRSARISAQALAAESIFDRDKEFHAKALHIADNIANIAKHKDAVQLNEQRLRALSVDFHNTLNILMEYSNNPEEIQNIANVFFHSSISFTNRSSERPLTWDEFQKTKVGNKEMIARLNGICKETKSTHPNAKASCEKARSIYNNYIETQQFILNDTVEAKTFWENVDAELRELRDSVSTGSEWNTNEALSGIEEASNRSKSIFQVMFGACVVFLILCLTIAFIAIQISSTTTKIPMRQRVIATTTNL